MGYIKKLKNNELVGGTDKTTIYPVTSTEAVFEEVIEDDESNFKSQKYLNNNITGDRINQETITNYNIAKGTLSEDRLDTALKTKVQEGYDTSWKFKGEYDKWATYDAHDVVYDPATNSSYISLQADNQWHPVNPDDEAYVEGWWQVIMNGKVSTDANNALVEYIENDLTQHVTDAISDANGAIQDMRSDTLEAYTEAEQLAQQITDWSSSEISSTPSYTDQHPLSNRASSAQIGYFECGTSSTTQASNQIKAVTAGGYALPTSGGAVKIKMYAANTYTPTTNYPVKLQFNEDATTLKELRYNNEAVSPTNTWDAGETISIYYDGSVYQASNSQGGGGKAERIKYDNTASGLAAANVQGAVDEIEDNFVFENTILTENASISYGISFISTQVGFEPNERYKIIVSLEAPQFGRISVYLSNIGSASGNVHQYIGSINAGDSSTELYYNSDSDNIYKYIYFYTEARISTTASVQVYELAKHNLDTMSQDIDAIKDIVGTDILLEKNNGLDYTLTNGYINLNGEAVVPSNNDWRKTDDFLPIPENSTVFSLENCKGHGNIATIAFYSAQSVDSLVDIVKIPNPSDIIFSYPKSPIPNGALYYRVSFGYNNATLSTQYILFYESSTIKTTVELLDSNIGTSYNGNMLFTTHYIRKATSFNYEYLYIEKGGFVSISSDINSSLNIYYCSNSQTWDANDYESIVLHTSTNPYNYTFTKSAGCIRIYNDGTSDINVTIQYKRNANASQQIKINEDIIGRIVEQVGGIQDSFAQSYFFREPVTGSLARVWTSNTLTQASKEKEWLVLYCHGNSDLIENATIPQTALDYFRANKINVAAIQYQDLNNTGIIGDGFNKYAWGNYTQFAHVIALYNYMQSHYNLHKTVVIAGISMGGLAMGALAYKKTFPIAFCLGVGAVPSLKKMWDNGGEQRKVPIRAAYGMAVDGSDDANVDTFFEGHDWWNMGMLTIGTDKYKIGFPNVYLYYGVDSVFNTDFGGLQTYSELCQSLLNGGVYSKIERVGDGHANPEIWTRSVVEDIWHNELGVPSHTE